MGLIFEHFFWELAIILVTLAFLGYLKIKKKLKFFEERGIPYVKPSIMDLWSFFNLDVTVVPRKIYDKAGDDNQIVGYFGIFLKPTILIKDPALVQTVLIKDFSHFHDHGMFINLDNNSIAANLFNLNGDAWRTMRHKLVPTFTSGKLKEMVPTMDECAERLTNLLKKDPGLCENVNMKDLFKEYTLGVIGSCAFGIDPESIKDPNCEFRRILNKAFQPSQSAMFKLFLVSIHPGFLKLLKIKIFREEVEEFFLSLTRETFELRKKTGVKRNDFVQLLLELKEKGSVDIDVKELEEDEKEHLKGIQSEAPSPAKLEITDALLSAQSFVFLLAGYENSAFLVAITTYVLSKCKQVQERVRQEIKEAQEKHGSINYNALNDMKLLRACIDEGLRLYSGGVLLRECTKTYTLRDGTKIEKGMSVSIPNHSLQTDGKYWDKPEEINPDRFLEGGYVPGTYQPFGDGPRICIAQRFALLQAKMMLAKIVENFEILPNKKTKEPLKIEVSVSVDVKGGLWGTLKPIEK